MSFSAQYPPVLTEAGDLTSEVLAKYNQEFQYLYTNLLSALFSATTGHAHTGNGSDGAQIAAGSIANDAITTLKILNETVTAAKLATDAVTTLKILDAAITTAKFALDAKCPLAGTADKVANALTVNGTAFDGSAAQEVIFPSHGQQLFTSSGTFTVPTGVTTVYVTGCGGGGGGGGGSNYGGIGGCGGGGGSIFKKPINVIAGGSVSVTVGLGGSSGAGTSSKNGNSGGSGGVTSFGAYVTINGGGGGQGGQNESTGATGSSGDYSADNGCSWFGKKQMPAGNSGSVGGNGSTPSIYGCGGGGGGGGTSKGGNGGVGEQGFIIVEW